ncbi:protein rep [Rhizobium leguminosarum]|uniref:protein rep n=1 Tax=Rhizobium leguminosarum TaxID=384 RepID=UPI001C914387|nr:protein rep [Rhizobium leguminosarum]MBY2975523.1 protein rep [Rhizobium leguminosarum]
MSISDLLFGPSSSPLSHSPVIAQQAALDAIAREMASASSAPSGHSQAGQQAAPQGRQAAQLDKRGARLTPAAETKAEAGVVVARWRLKHTVATILRDAPGEKTPGVCKCGTAGYQQDFVHLVRRLGRPGVKGVYFCDSPWLCPSCAPRRAAERAERVQRVFDATEKRGGAVVFLTLTVQHAQGQALADLKKLVMDACTKARQGKPWELAQKRYGIAGVMVGPEVTWSPASGWHFHLHVAVPMLPDVSTVEPGKRWGQVVEIAQAGGDWIVKRYREYIERAGGRADAKAQDVQVMWRKEDLSDYLAKGSGAWEVASAGATKQGKKGLTPWDIAARAKASKRYRALFIEYAQAMPGTRSCVITKSLAEALGVEPADDKDKGGVEEVDKEEVVVGSVEPPRWRRVLRLGHAPAVLQAVADRVAWSEIDSMMTRLLDPPRASHAPSPEHIARLVKASRHQSRDLGEVVRLALDRERAFAVSIGRAFEPPPLRQVLELMAA